MEKESGKPRGHRRHITSSLHSDSDYSSPPTQTSAWRALEQGILRSRLTVNHIQLSVATSDNKLKSYQRSNVVSYDLDPVHHHKAIHSCPLLQLLPFLRNFFITAALQPLGPQTAYFAPGYPHLVMHVPPLQHPQGTSDRLRRPCRPQSLNSCFIFASLTPSSLSRIPRSVAIGASRN